MSKSNRAAWSRLQGGLAEEDVALKQSHQASAGRLRKVFRRRAERLASRSIEGRPAAAGGRRRQVLIFALASETYGIELGHVAQVFGGVPVTPVPGAREFVSGVANLRGEVRSVLDLRRMLQLADGDAPDKRYVLLLRSDGRQLGLQVDRIEGIREISWDELSKGEGDSRTNRSSYAHGVTGDGLIVLNEELLFQPDVS